MGSGTILRAYYKAIGKQYFTKEVLHVFDNFDDMNNKEIEIVNEEFIKREDTMNIALGGFGNVPSTNMVAVRPKGSSQKYYQLDKEIYHKNKHLYETPSSNLITVKNEHGQWVTINRNDYDPTTHQTPSRGRISVYDTNTGETKSILKVDFDTTIHKPVFGGKVIKDENGVIRYATESDSATLSGIHKGKITAIENATGVTKHVTSAEFYGNPGKYTHLTTGKTYGKHKETGESCQFIISEITDDIRAQYSFSTSGQRTVYDIETKKWKNIPKDDFDTTKHRSTRDVKLQFHTPSGIYEFWGSKADFLKKHNLPGTLWDQCVLTPDGKFYTAKKKNSEWNGSYIKLENWK
jgi:hypothetical protein